MSHWLGPHMNEILKKKSFSNITIKLDALGEKMKIEF